MIGSFSKVAESESLGINEGFCVLTSLEDIQAEVNFGGTHFVMLCVFNCIVSWKFDGEEYSSDTILQAVADFLDSSHASLDRYQIGIPCEYVQCKIHLCVCVCVCVFKQLEMLCRIVPYSLEWKTPDSL